MECKYVIKFIPENNYGCIAKSANDKNEAYKIYKRLKKVVDIRQGHLFILEKIDGKEKYLCNYKTGQSKDAETIINEIEKLNKQLSNIYNIYELENKIKELSTLETDIIHGIELLDSTKVDYDKKCKEIIDKQKEVTSIRRQYKQDLNDANAICTYLRGMIDLTNSMKDKISKNKKYRNNDNIKDKVKYLKAINVDTERYFEIND